jgi:hypothetical protein
MGYELKAIIAHAATFAPPPSWLADSRVIALEKGVSMIPITDALYDGLRGDGAAMQARPWLSAGFEKAMLELSHRGFVAFIEASFAGGIGSQDVIGWRDGRVVLGPLEAHRAINQALRILGVRRSLLADEFLAVELDRYRETGDWLGLT